jgi:hypothetical protein
MKINLSIAQPDTQPRFVVSQRLCVYLNNLIQRNIFDKTPALAEYEARIIAVMVTTRNGQERTEATTEATIQETSKHTYYHYSIYLPQQSVPDNEQYPQEQFVVGLFSGLKQLLATYGLPGQALEDLLEVALLDLQKGNYMLTEQERTLAREVNYAEVKRIEEYRAANRKGNRRR